jgi:hypothetical protein
MHKIKAFLASIRGLMHIKNNYSRNVSKLPPKHALLQYKPKEPINTPIALMDLATHIYD